MSSLQNDWKYIQENIGHLSLKTIARNLGKSVNAVEMTLYRKTGATNTKVYTGKVTAGELANILKVERNTVMGWIRKHGLKYSRQVTHSHKIFTFIDVEEFWDWCFNNLHRVDLSQVEPYVLLPQPSWFAKERKKKKTTNYKAWTIQEERRLLQLIQSGESQKEIAKILNRTPDSIQKKYGRLK